MKSRFFVILFLGLLRNNVSAVLTCTAGDSPTVISSSEEGPFTSTCPNFDHFLYLAIGVRRVTRACHDVTGDVIVETERSVTSPYPYSCAAVSFPSCQGDCSSTSGKAYANCAYADTNIAISVRCSFDYDVINCDALAWSSWSQIESCGGGRSKAVWSRTCIGCDGEVPSTYCDGGIAGSGREMLCTTTSTSTTTLSTVSTTLSTTTLSTVSTTLSTTTLSTTSTTTSTTIQPTTTQPTTTKPTTTKPTTTKPTTAQPIKTKSTKAQSTTTPTTAQSSTITPTTAQSTTTPTTAQSSTTTPTTAQSSTTTPTTAQSTRPSGGVTTSIMTSQATESSHNPSTYSTRKTIGSVTSQTQHLSSKNYSLTTQPRMTSQWKSTDYYHSTIAAEDQENKQSFATIIAFSCILMLMVVAGVVVLIRRRGCCRTTGSYTVAVVFKNRENGTTPSRPLSSHYAEGFAISESSDLDILAPRASICESDVIIS